MQVKMSMPSMMMTSAGSTFTVSVLERLQEMYEYTGCSTLFPDLSSSSCEQSSSQSMASGWSKLCALFSSSVRSLESL